MVFTEKASAAPSRPSAPVFSGRKVMRLFRILSAALLGGALFASPASAQEERTIRWGHLNNTDHPVSFGVQKFAEILSAKSGGKLNIREFPSSPLRNQV